jgi:hypothetical protein
VNFVAGLLTDSKLASHFTIFKTQVHPCFLQKFTEFQFLVPDWGMKPVMMSGCGTGPILEKLSTQTHSTQLEKTEEEKNGRLASVYNFVKLYFTVIYSRNNSTDIGITCLFTIFQLYFNDKNSDFSEKIVRRLALDDFPSLSSANIQHINIKHDALFIVLH